MSDGFLDNVSMSDYERKRWRELQTHWEKKAEGKRAILPAKARAALDTTVRTTKGQASKAVKAVVEHTPERVKGAANFAVDAALTPTVHHVLKMLELVNDWVVELTDPKAILEHHRQSGRDVRCLSDLRRLDLKDLEMVTDGMALRWRTLGAGQGASFGALAMIPVPILGSVAAIGLDTIAMQALTGAIATRICYSYGYDAKDPEMKYVIDRMVSRTYRQLPVKAGSMKKAAEAFNMTKGRVNWSQKLREDHGLMAAVEKLLTWTNGGSAVTLKNVRMGMPFIAVFAGAATNSHVLGDTVKQARHYGATVMLAEKYGLPLPPNLGHDLDEL